MENGLAMRPKPSTGSGAVGSNSSNNKGNLSIQVMLGSVEGTDIKVT